LPGPPAIVYAAISPAGLRTFKATLQAFFLVNQAAILLGNWLAGPITAEVVRLTGLYVLPTLARTLWECICSTGSMVSAFVRSSSPGSSPRVVPCVRG